MSPAHAELIAKLEQALSGRMLISGGAAELYRDCLAALTTPAPPVTVRVSEKISGSERHDGSTDLYIKTPDVSVLCNVEAGQSFTYAVSADGCIKSGTVGFTTLAPDLRAWVQHKPTCTWSTCRVCAQPGTSAMHEGRNLYPTTKTHPFEPKACTCGLDQALHGGSDV